MKKFLSTLLVFAMCVSMINTVVFANSPDLPAYTVKALGEKTITTTEGDYELQLGMNFSAVESPEDAKGKFYEHYNADFVISFDRVVCAEDLAFAGYYSEYCDKYNNGKWVLLPICEEIDYIMDNTPVRVMQIFEKLGGIDVSEYTGVSYKDIVTLIKSFDCGIIVNEDSDLDGLKVTLGLNLYETELIDGKYVETGAVYPVIEATEYIYTEPDRSLPDYTSSFLGDKVIETADDEYELKLGMNFSAVQTAEEAKGKFYEHYNGDFVISFNRDVCADDLALAGYYSEYCDKYNNGKWIIVPIGEEGEIIPANTPLRVMQLFERLGNIDVTDYNGVSYKDIVSLIKSFDCGIVMADEAELDGLEVSLGLNLYETTYTNGAYEETGVVHTIIEKIERKYVENIITEDVVKEVTEEDTYYTVTLSNVEKDGYLIVAAYKENGAFISAQIADVTANTTEYTISFDNSIIESANCIKAFVWDGMKSVAPISTTLIKSTSEIEEKPLPAVPEEVLSFNYSDDFLYRFGTVNVVPVDVTYTIDSEEAEITSENTVFEWTTDMGNAKIESIDIENGEADMTLSGSGQITLTAYPASFAKDETKKVSFTFEVLDGLYNVSRKNKTLPSYNSFCLASDVTSLTFALKGNQIAYGNGYTIDNTAFKATAGKTNGALGYLYDGAAIDNINIKGPYVDDFYLGTNSTVANNYPEKTWSVIQIYNMGTVTNSNISYGKSGIRIYQGTANIENVSVYNSVMPFNMQNGTTFNFKNITVDQILTPEDEAAGHKYGSTVVAEAGTATTINVLGDMHFHTFMSDAEISKMPDTAKDYINIIFDSSNDDFKFNKNGNDYVNPVFIATGSAANSVVINISENSNLYGKLSTVSKSLLGNNAKAWALVNSGNTAEESDYMFSKPGNAARPGKDQTAPVANSNYVGEYSAKAENGSITYDFSNVNFVKYNTNLSYTATATKGTINGTTLTLPATEDTTSILTYTVTDHFAGKTYTYETAVHATVPSYAPMLVFAAPTGKNPGANESSAFEYYGRNYGNTFDPDFDIDLDSSYGFAAYDCKGNRIYIDNTATTGARVTVTAQHIAGLKSTGLTPQTGGAYFSSKSDKVDDNASYTQIAVTYTAYDSVGRSTSATRYYKISNKKTGTILKTYSSWKSSNAYSFASRNSFSDITYTWNGVNSVTSSSNNHYVVSGAVEE